MSGEEQATALPPGRTAGLRKPRLAAAACVLLLLSLGVVSSISYRNTITPHGIIIHHSGVTTTFDGQPVDVNVLAGYHRRRGFGIFYWGKTYHIGYHYIIFPDGRVEPGRPERCQGAHAVGRNSDLGICLVGNFSTADNPHGADGMPEPTAAQMEALLALGRRLRERYSIPLERVRLHRDVSTGTVCPGDRFPFEQFIGRLGETAVAAR
jgi:hypothetical protein